MTKHAAYYLLSVLPIFVGCEPAQASAWQLCRLELRITHVLTRPTPQLQARVLKVMPGSTTAECPEEGATLTFTPETPDYQAQLPRRRWPSKGQTLHVDYRYLDGICKGDGNDYACRIKHYPVVGP